MKEYSRAILQTGSAPPAELWAATSIMWRLSIISGTDAAVSKAAVEARYNGTW
jgi:hypothetical protein